jgi:hypothetical protein
MGLLYLYSTEQQKLTYQHTLFPNHPFIVRDPSFTTSLIGAASSNTKPLSATKSHGSYSDQGNVKRHALYFADKTSQQFLISDHTYKYCNKR